MKSKQSLLAAGLAWQLCLLGAARLHAEPSGAERATAEALFQQGTALMSEQKFQAACEKFEGSEQLDPALGTMLRLADCYDRAGKTASAWSMFSDVVSAAREKSDAERLQIATDRAADLEKRLSMLQIDVDEASSRLELTIRSNGTVVPRATWNAPMPVDPGSVRLEVTAPGRQAWTATVEIGRGPVLEKRVVPALALSTAPRAPATGAAASGAASRNATSPRSSSLSTLGYALGGAGLVGLGSAGVLGYRAKVLNDESRSHCRPTDPSACSGQGLSLRSDARHWANGATVSVIAGSALLVGGVVLLLSAPSTEQPKQAATQVSLRVTPMAGVMALEGSF